MTRLFTYEWHVFKQDWNEKREASEKSITGFAQAHLDLIDATPVTPWAFVIFPGNDYKTWRVEATCLVRVPQLSLV